jgi:trans-aconitate methyltransferase
MWNPNLYDDRHAFVWKMGADVIELLDPKAGEHILDLGCGTGHLTSKIVESGATAIGIDSSAEMIAKAKSAYPDLVFEVQDARQLTEEDRFDAIFSNAVLHWIKEPEKVAQGIARSLKPGGRFVAEMGGYGNVATIVASLQAASKEMGLGDVQTPWYFPTVGQYASLLEGEGLAVSYAVLFDRPSPLKGEEGLRKWVEGFGSHFLMKVLPEQRSYFLERVEHYARPKLYRDEHWIGDYRRLRVVAHSTKGV